MVKKTNLIIIIKNVQKLMELNILKHNNFLREFCKEMFTSH